jgi:autophagy-related protein 9
MRIRQANPSTAEESPSRRRNALFSKQRMDALDIASRIMRKDNYFIALVNRDVLDLSLPVPFLRSRPMLSKTLEWSLNLCIIKYVFDEQGQLRPVFTKDVHKRLLSDGYILHTLFANRRLRRRFKFVGFMNLIFAPFIVIYLLLLHFFRYFEVPPHPPSPTNAKEYHSVPGALGSRQYTPLAQWKFREFNELYHIFKKRMDFSSKFASKYIDQFPKETTAQLFRYPQVEPRG